MICPSCGEDPCGVYARCTTPVVTDDEEKELIEVMAKRICAENFDKWNARSVQETLSGNEPEENRDSYRFVARAALSALREAGYEIRQRDKIPEREGNAISE